MPVVYQPYVFESVGVVILNSVAFGDDYHCHCEPPLGGAAISDPQYKGNKTGGISAARGGTVMYGSCHPTH